MADKCVNCGKTFGQHYAMRCESGSDESTFEPSTEGTQAAQPGIHVMSQDETFAFLDKKMQPYLDTIASLTQRLQASEAREDELKAEIAKMQMDNVIDYKAACEQHAANYEALERSHAKLLEAVNEALGCIDPGVYPDTVLELQEVKSAAEKL